MKRPVEKIQTGFNQNAVCFNTHDTALLVVDVQELYFNPAHFGTKTSDRVARKIASFLPILRAKNIPVYAVYFASRVPEFDYFYRFRPTEKDIIVRKKSFSALETGKIISTDPEKDLGEHLEKAGIKNLVICGGYLSVCVEETVMQALGKKFNVTVIDNLTTDGDGRDDYEDLRKEAMRRNGAHFMHARDIYKNIKI